MEDDEEHRPTTAMVAASEEPPTYADAEHTISDVRLGPGEEVGGYVIDCEIGKGGMGHVYRATHPVIGKRAAIKVLKAEVSKNPIVVERFIQEARAVNRIGHPSIVDIFAFGALPDGRAYHIMDLLEGESLRKRVKRGPLHVSEVAAIVGDTASALQAAHDKGFVHRDLKPDNVFLVERDGQWPDVKLLDFGLAKLMPEAGVSPFTTKTGVMLGTPEYMSPEQARGQGVDYRTDIYALGVLTFELLARQRPFPSTGDAFAMMQAHIEELPPSLRDLVPGLPDELVQLVEAMLAKDPAARPSLAAVRNVIKRLRTTLPSRTAMSLELPAALPPAPPPGPLRTSGLAAADDPDAARTVQNLRRASAPPLEAHTTEALPPTSPRAAPPPRIPSTAAGLGPVPSYQSMHVSSGGSVAGPPLPGALGSVPSYQSMHVSASSPGALPQSGLASPSQPGMATRLGVEPARVRAAIQAAAAAPAPGKPSRVWLVVGALVAIAAGVGVALLAVGW